MGDGQQGHLPITPDWECKRDQNLLDKDDIMNAYAASYEPTLGDEVLYFALERNGNNGAANVGFWFLQDATVDCAAPDDGPTNIPFTGSHVDGDLLVVSEFTQGGTVSTIVVYRWTDPDGDGLDPGFDDGPRWPSARLRQHAHNRSIDDEACANVNSPGQSLRRG